MSYAQRKELSGNRTMSMVFTIIVVGGLMYAIVTGLAYNVIKKSAENLKVIDIEQPPPPPEKPPPPPKDMPKVPPPPMQPPPLVRTVTPPPPIQTVTSTVIPPQAPPTFSPPRPPPPPALPPAPRQSEPKSAVGDLQNLIHNDDYPPSAADNNEQGTTRVVLTVGASGRVTGCSVSSSSGSRALDQASCRLLTARARFTPAQDSSGNPTSGSVSANLRWVLAE